MTSTWWRKQARYAGGLAEILIAIVATGIASLGIGGIILIGLFGWLILPPFLWPYTVNSWLHFFGVNWTMTWWMGYLFLFIPYVRRMMIPLAIVTFILMLFLT